MAIKKLIVVIEVEIEKDLKELGDEVCKRIAMHPNVHDANVLSVSYSREYLHAPKPGN